MMIQSIQRFQAPQNRSQNKQNPTARLNSPQNKMGNAPNFGLITYNGKVSLWGLCRLAKDVLPQGARAEMHVADEALRGVKVSPEHEPAVAQYFRNRGLKVNITPDKLPKPESQAEIRAHHNLNVLSEEELLD